MCKRVSIPCAYLYVETPVMLGSCTGLIRQAQQNPQALLTAHCCLGWARSSWVSLPLMHRDGVCPDLCCLHYFCSLPPCRSTSPPPTQHVSSRAPGIKRREIAVPHGCTCHSLPGTSQSPGLPWKCVQLVSAGSWTWFCGTPSGKEALC